ncbi:MAG TPA: carboxypeptidase regulatory-like domain-containing protein [Terriglobales bacterium]|nr:carboxypeptidase regulatory-like domain-containing protein [Terriglobales bacterium]
MKRILLITILVSALQAFAQGQTATLNGKVTDQTGAVIPQATVTVTAADGKQSTATTNQEGSFQIQSLAPGTYSVSAGAKGFATLQKPGVELTAGQPQTLNLSLEVQVQEEKVNVQSEGTQLDVGASSNANAIVIKGKDLEALSDDPDELQSELQALAGPAAGPNGGQIYIDGFTGGQLPPKSSIREIRINQNPFSAQYDKLGYGRIEIFTKPGTDQFHGQFFFNDTNAIFNSKNPYVPTKPDYNSEIFDGNLGGPINKKASFFIDASRRNMNDFSAISATVIDPVLGITQLQESIANPRTRTNFNPRVDYQLSQNNTLTLRYQLTHDSDQNSGLGTFSLPSQAYNLNETEHTVQISDTQIFGPNIVNETRFQFQRETNHQLPLGFGPEINVQGNFIAGQNNEGLVRTTQNNYELQNYTSITHHNHLIKFGARVRGITSSESTNANFNGTFTFSPFGNDPAIARFSALQAYQNAAAGMCVAGNFSPQNCPTQFSIVTGSPNVSVGWFDAGLYVEDEWRAKPNLSFTYGLRLESQNNIHDHADFAPRVGISYGLGNGRSAPKTVLRAGFGIFYDRFGYNLVEQANLLNGVTQQRVTIRNPDFFPTPGNPVPPFSVLQAMATAAPTVYSISPDLRAPYTIQSAASIERQVTKAATVSVTYVNSRGEHMFYIDNVNAPFFAGGPTPNGTNENIYRYSSGGIFRQNQVIANIRLTTSRYLSLFGFYTLSYANSSVSSGGGPGGFFSSGTTTMASFLSDQYDPLADYGRAAFDVRHRAFIGGNISLPYAFALSPFVIINSGQPYNLTTGQDNNDDSIFNDRPWLVSDGVISCTSRGDFSLVPTSAGVAPLNYCTGPGNLTLNLRLSKTIGFGRETKGGSGGGGGGGPHMHGPRGSLGPGGLSGAGGGNPFRMGASTNRRYSLTFSISARNLLNSFNPGPPVGNLSSPNFGQSIMIGGGPFGSASANRRIDLQVRFAF